MIYKLAPKLIIIISILVLILIQKLLNFKKIKRDRQYLLPIISLIYCIAVIVIFRVKFNWFNELIAVVQSIFDMLNTSQVFVRFNINMPVSPLGVISYALLLVMFCGFFVLKTFLRPLLRAFCKRGRFLHDKISGFFYYENEEIGIECLKNRWTQLKEFVYALWVVLVTSLILYVNDSIFDDGGSFPAIIYPALGLIVASEILFYFNGYTYSEYMKYVLGEDAIARKMRNYSLLRNVYRRLFADRIKYENTFTNMQSVDNKPTDLIDECIKSKQFNDEILASVLQKNLDDGISVDANLAMACKNLLYKQSVLFSTPFYKDISTYVFLPINQTLINENKCLIIIGRHDSENRIFDWAKQEIDNISGVPNYWKVQQMSTDSNDFDIGVIDLNDLSNLEIYQNNLEFLSNVGLVFVIEPSNLLSTQQIAFEIYMKKCSQNGDFVFAGCDRSVDGLVDSISHVIKESVLEVSALSSVNNVSSVMVYDADGEYLHNRLFSGVSRYLGVGTELGIVAVKSQIEKAAWYSFGKFPVKEMAWFSAQYYKSLCTYAGIELTTYDLEKSLAFETDVYGIERKKNQLIIVEDEYNNIFEMYRYLNTRIQNQCFINIISSEYMMKQYMIDNSHIFIDDSKAVPAFASDFVRSVRNTIIKLVLLMLQTELSIDYIEREFEHSMIDYSDGVSATLEELISKYILGKKTRDLLTVVFKQDYSEKVFGESKEYYYISEKDAIRADILMLKHAYYILEDENIEEHIVGSALIGHVYQKHLPGQFMVYDGKNYEVTSISNERGILVKRASEHIHRRYYYKQRRVIDIKQFVPYDYEGAVKTVNGIKLTSGYSDFAISVSGYDDMQEKGNLVTSQYVEVSNIPERQYLYKRALKIELPDISEKTKNTITMMLNELFYTTFPNDYHYVYAICANSDKSGLLDSVNISDNSIFILEDSQMDLGLLETVERNMFRYLEIITDYLLWSDEKQSAKEQQEHDVDEEEPSDDTIDSGKLSWWKRLWNKIKSFFKRKKKRAEDSEEESRDDAIDDDIENEVDNIDYYLNFGFDEVPEIFDIMETKDYLCGFGFDKSYINQARNRMKWGRNTGKDYVPDLKNTKYCDFCGAILTGVSYSVLDDGRNRCDNCSQNAINDFNDFVEILNTTKMNMECLFNITLYSRVNIRLCNAKKIARLLGKKFVATDGFDFRAVGFARKSRDEYSIYIENGAPKVRTISTIAHEYTHIWQYINWTDVRKFRKLENMSKDEIYEGMASWVEIQYLILIGEAEQAARQEAILRKRNDEYGRGFIKIVEKYPLSYSNEINGKTPFELKDGKV